MRGNKVIGTCHGAAWRVIPVFALVTAVVARVNNAMFLGNELCEHARTRGKHHQLADCDSDTRGLVTILNRKGVF